VGVQQLVVVVQMVVVVDVVAMGVLVLLLRVQPHPMLQPRMRHRGRLSRLHGLLGRLVGLKLFGC